MKQHMRKALACTAMALTVMVANAQPTEILVSDSQANALYLVDVLSGDRTLVHGSDWGRPLHLVEDGLASVIVHDDFNGTLERIDVMQGTSELIAGPAKGSGLPLHSIADLRRLDEDTIVGVTRAPSEIFMVDLATGDRTTLPTPTGIQDDPWPDLRTLLVEDVAPGADPTVLVPERVGNRVDTAAVTAGLYRVNLNTASWEMVTASAVIPEDVPIKDFKYPSVILPTGGETTLMIDLTPPSISYVQPGEEIFFTVDLTLGGEGDPLQVPIAAHREDDNHLLVLDRALCGIYRVELPSGQRTTLSKSGSVGTGPSLDSPLDMVVSPSGDVAWVLSDQGSKTIIEVNLTNGNRRAVYSAHLQGGDQLEVAARDLVRRGNGNVLALTNGGWTLHEINLSTWTLTERMRFDIPFERITEGPGTGTLWGLRAPNEIHAIDFVNASTELVYLGSGSAQIITDIAHLSPTQMFLKLDRGPAAYATVILDTTDTGTLIGDPEDIFLGSFTNGRLTMTNSTDVIYPRDAEPAGTTSPTLLQRDTVGEVYNPPFEYIGYDNEPISGHWYPEDPSIGTGPRFHAIRQFEVDENGDLWVLDFDPAGSALVRVDIDSGDRVQVSGPLRGDGPLWSSTTTLCLLDGIPSPETLQGVLEAILGLTTVDPADLPLYDLDGSGRVDAPDITRSQGP